MVGILVPLPVVLSWSVSLFLELVIVASFALWVATSTGKNVASVLATFAFYLLSRAIQGMQAMASGPFFDAESAYDQFIAACVAALAWVMPPALPVCFQ